MWESIRRHLEDYPERLKVARVLVEKGLTVRNGKIYLNEIEIPSVRIARAAGVDRRTVSETIATIAANRELRDIFEGLRSAGHSLKEIA
ncbi:MAG: amino acid-binding protein, partial [Candidatus Bathyarchaeia archaeon]